MKSRDLPRVELPAPPPPPSCAACKAFRPEVVTPYGDGAMNCCWLCAHAIVEHGCTLEEAPTNECECLPEEVYPDDIIARRSEHQCTSVGCTLAQQCTCAS